MTRSKRTPDGDAAVGMKPLLNPPALSGWQGSSKDDSTTEWFYSKLTILMTLRRQTRHTFGLKLNWTVVRGSSVMLFGVKVKFPPKPTATRSTRWPPNGRPSGGEVLVGASFAFNLKASIVFPEVGLEENQPTSPFPAP
jgi:hypothetical protein